MSSEQPQPALAPPDGVQSNFDDPPNEHAMIIGVMAMFIVLTTAFTMGRMWTRWHVHQELWWDDWAMVVSWIGIIGLIASLLIELRFGGGVDMWNVTKADYDQFERVFSDLENVARLSIFFAKLSILLLYLRIFFPKRTQKTQMWWWIWAVIWFNLLYTVALVLVVTLQCAPYGLPFGSSCLDQYAILVSASVINVVSDVAVLLIPVQAVWRLQMARNRKVGLFVVFAFGAFAPLSSIARLAYQIPEANDANRTKVLVIVIILAQAENVIAVIVGCMPVLAVWFFSLQSKRSRPTNPGAHPRSLSARFWPARGSRASGSTGPRGRSTRRAGKSDPYPLTAISDVDDTGENYDDSRVATSPSRDEDPKRMSVGTQAHWASTPPIYGVSPPTTTITIEGGLQRPEGRGRGPWG